jgi:ubiquinone/menaquinone biosynthesis C-methylase UbiE
MPTTDQNRIDLDHREVARFYDEVYYQNASGKAKPSNDLLRLANRLDLRPRQKVLDIACGTGNWLDVASTNGLDVAGIDISSRAIEICRERMPGGQFHVGQAESLPFDTCSFDLVTCLGSLEHFLDQPAALLEMKRVVKPGGRLVILVPNAGFLTHRLGLYRGTHQQAVKETIRTLDTWGDMFQAAGLEVTDRWRDLHILEYGWIVRPPWLMVLPRLIQALALPIWPLSWQYQVFHLCEPRR